MAQNILHIINASRSELMKLAGVVAAAQKQNKSSELPQQPKAPGNPDTPSKTTFMRKSPWPNLKFNDMFQQWRKARRKASEPIIPSK